MVIALLFISLISAAHIPDLTRLDYTIIPTHKVYGIIKTDGSPFGVLSLTGDAFIISDSVNNRWLLWYQLTFPTTPPTTITEFSWVLSNTSYTFGSFSYPGCLQSNGFNWTNFVTSNKDLFSLPHSRYPGKSSYMGLIYDSASCGRPAAQLILLKNNKFSQYSIASNVLLPGGICYNSKNIFKFDLSTIEYDGFDSDFILPSSCYPENNPPNFCDYNPSC